MTFNKNLFIFPSLSKSPLTKKIVSTILKFHNQTDIPDYKCQSGAELDDKFNPDLYQILSEMPVKSRQ